MKFKLHQFEKKFVGQYMNITIYTFPINVPATALSVDWLYKKQTNVKSKNGMMSSKKEKLNVGAKTTRNVKHPCMQQNARAWSKRLFHI